MLIVDYACAASQPSLPQASQIKDSKKTSINAVNEKMLSDRIKTIVTASTPTVPQGVSAIEADTSRENGLENLTSIASGVLLGVLSSLIVAMFVEWMKKPRLCISIVPPEQVQLLNGGRVIDTLMSLRVNVTNRPLPIYLRWMQRQSARDCRATLQFLREDATPFIVRLMPGRWTSSVQPVPLQGVISSSGNTIEIHDIARLTAESRVHIPAGESERLDVAVRFNNAPEAFGWTNESYRHGSRHPDFTLPTGRYLVDIIIQSEGVRKRDCFWLENDHTITKFRLAPR